MVETARFFMRFTQNESCGKCVPCREGTKRMLEILDRIIANEGSLEDLDLLQELSKTISETDTLMFLSFYHISNIKLIL